MNQNALGSVSGFRGIYLLIVALNATVVLLLGSHHNFKCVRQTVERDDGGGVGVGHLAQVNVWDVSLGALTFLSMSPEPLKGLREAMRDWLILLVSDHKLQVSKIQIRALEIVFTGVANVEDVCDA